jgi:hypothetical protein
MLKLVETASRANLSVTEEISIVLAAGPGVYTYSRIRQVNRIAQIVASSDIPRRTMSPKSLKDMPDIERRLRYWVDKDLPAPKKRKE